MKWNIYIFNINTSKIQTLDIFQHGFFKNEVEEKLAHYTDKEKFAEALRMSLMYYFRCKAEYEVLIGPWISPKDEEFIKIDIYDQVMLNWENFVDYVWGFKNVDSKEKI